MTIEKTTPKEFCDDCGLYVDKTIQYRGKLRCDDCIVKHDKSVAFENAIYRDQLRAHYYNSSGCHRWYCNEKIGG